MYSDGDRFPVISSLLDEIDFRDNKLKDESKVTFFFMSSPFEIFICVLIPVDNLVRRNCERF